jgi:hypothetical protein
MPEKPDTIEFLSTAEEAVKDFASVSAQIEKQFKRADEQDTARKKTIQIINAMCDALQLAGDLISREITEATIEYNKISDSKTARDFKSFFNNVAFRFSRNNIGDVLTVGKVCGELHALGDSYAQPLSKPSRTGVAFYHALAALFTRSTPMSRALSGLYHGEREYLNSISYFLQDLIDDAAAAGGERDLKKLRNSGAHLVCKMREKKRSLHDQTRKLRDAADVCVETLH